MAQMAAYGKDDFELMIQDWQADHSPEMDALEIGEAFFDDEWNHWAAYAHDDKTVYVLTDDGTGNIVINYVGTR